MAKETPNHNLKHVHFHWLNSGTEHTYCRFLGETTQYKHFSRATFLWPRSACWPHPILKQLRFMHKFEFAGAASKKGRTGANSRLGSVKTVCVPRLIWPKACDIPSLLAELTSLQDIHMHTEHKCSSLQKMFQTKTCQRHSWETWQTCKFLCSVSSVCIHLTMKKKG